jgi:uncharacterized protein (TIGR02453 family)
MEPTRFKGFPSGLFEFLCELANNNNKDWFDANRDRYQSQVLGITKSFVTEIGPILSMLNQEIEIEPRVGRTISRINNDIRFHKHKPPYRPFMYVSFAQRGSKWATAPMLFIGLQSHGLSMGFYPGGYRKRRIGPLQESIKNNLRLFQRYLDERRIARSYSELTDAELGVPAKWPLPETARRWVKLESFTVGEYFPSSDTTLSRRSFLDRVQRTMINLYPLWLFATSEDIPSDLDLYWENAELLARPLTKMAS